MALPASATPNEFYRRHYLESVADRDHQEGAERWAEQAKARWKRDSDSGGEHPEAAVQSNCANPAEAARRRTWHHQRSGERCGMQRELFLPSTLLEALNYPTPQARKPY